MSDPQRIFRFALYGRASAGKTCILATLAMPHLATEGLSCIWRGTAADAPRPEGPEDSWRGDDPAVARYRGTIWLRSAIAALGKGEQPLPNPNSREPFRFRYDFKDRGFDYRVELIDYSGELLEPDISTSQLTQRLREHLREFDGILVLGEAPPRGESGGAYAAELHRLQMAFALLREEGTQSLATGAVIGLVFNKWDRRMIGTARESLIAFFCNDDSRSHRGLRDALQTSCPDNFEVFAASAFGRLRQERGRDLPPGQVPMPSFGLEEPFVWAARRKLTQAADGDLVSLEGMAGRFTWWRVGQPFTANFRRMAEQVRALHETYPLDFPHHQKADEILARARKARRPQLVALAASLLLLWGLGTAAIDYIGYSSHRATILTGDDIDVSRLEAAEQWLMSHADHRLWRSPLGGLVLSASQSRQRLEEVQHRLVLARDLAAKNHENRIALGGWKERFATACDLAAVTDVAAACRRLPWPERVADDIRLEYAELRQQIDARHQTLKHAVAVGRQEREYYEAMARRNLSDAAGALAGGSLPAALDQKLRKHFTGNAVTMLREDVEDSIREQRWKEGCERIKACRADNNVKRLLANEQLVEIDDLRLKVEARQDRWLYDLCRRDKTPEACRRYLDESLMANPRMKGFVEKYHKYWDNVRGELMLTVSLSRIDWGAAGWGGAPEKNRVRVWVNGSGDPNLDATEVESKANTSTSDVGKFTWKGRLDDQVSLRVWIWRDSFIFLDGKREHGEGSRTISLRELANGDCEVGLNRFDNKAFLKVVGGIPTVPPLPVYQE